MPIVFMVLSSIVVLAAFILPIKWILETEAASASEKTVFILLTFVLSIFSYYLFYSYMKHFKTKET